MSGYLLRIVSRSGNDDSYKMQTYKHYIYIIKVLFRKFVQIYSLTLQLMLGIGIIFIFASLISKKKAVTLFDT